MLCFSFPNSSLSHYRSSFDPVVNQPLLEAWMEWQRRLRVLCLSPRDIECATPKIYVFEPDENYLGSSEALRICEQVCRLQNRMFFHRVQYSANLINRELLSDNYFSPSAATRNPHLTG